MKKTIWILVDNRIGSRHQAEGIANYLNPDEYNVIYKEVAYTKFAALPNFIRGKTLLGLNAESKKSIVAPYPDLVLSSTRRTAPIARYIKKCAPAVKLVQLIHIGRCGIKDFSLVFVPEHDRHKVSFPNIRYTIGCPHYITPDKLAVARQEWCEKFNLLPHPVTALIIGGAIKKHKFSLENAEQLAQLVKKQKSRDGGSLLITTSRRTGSAAEQKIMSYLADIPHYAFLWGSKEKNPYLGFLACADDFIITGDSVSMCCEATAAGKCLKIFTGNNWLRPKHLSFVQSLYDAGYASALSDAVSASPLIAAPLNTAKEIAALIAEL